MPKETFINLPEEKKIKIEKAAIQEFVDYPYDGASINRIVERAEISKGSFYQYFEDKKDIYKHIINKIVEEKIKYMSPLLFNPGSLDFFTLIKELFLSALRFAQSRPDLVVIGNRLLADRNHPLYVEIMSENTTKSVKIYQDLLKKAIDEGNVRDTIDITMTASFVTNLSIFIAEYYKEHINETIDEKILETVEKCLDILKNGIGAIKI